MKNIDWGNVAIVVIVLAAICAFIFLTGIVISESMAEAARIKSCQDAGYVGSWLIDGVYFCYGYVEGNQLITKPFDDLEARMGE